MGRRLQGESGKLVDGPSVWAGVHIYGHRRLLDRSQYMPRDKKKERRTKLEKEKRTLEMMLGKNNAKAYKGMLLPEYTMTSRLVL